LQKNWFILAYIVGVLGGIALNFSTRYIAFRHEYLSF